ncbi:HAMP domain-containing protein [Paenibacillus albiflavus]|uniref:histidine kinase n=1 Tax=Paenibacillus albiflavus TaxID=2545760 RepID=A0A4R4E5G0_9BACL|nr:sensor histidine kinase [Paenibacillus albiflavus]TCZ72878.1 HAMP domain-containing protein [Paenibacillus albiflavus]
MTKLQTRRSLPFGYKLMLSYCLFLIVPVGIVVVLANYTYVSSIREQTTENIHGTLQQIKDNITYKFESSQRVSDLLYNDRTLAKRLKHYEEGWVSYEATTQYLMPLFSKMVESTNYNIWLSVYMHNNTLPEIYHVHDNSNPLATFGRFNEQYYITRIQNKDWYKQFPEEKYGVTMEWKQIENDERFDQISLLRRVVDNVDPMNLKEIAFIRIVVAMSDLFQSVDYHKIGESSSIFIVGDHNEIIHYSGDHTSLKGQTWDDSLTENNLVIKEQLTLAGLNWSLVTLVPNDIMERGVTQVLYISLVICLICIVVFFLIGGFITRYFTKRVHKIVSVLNAFREGDFHKRMPNRGNDEFSQITSALNEMGQNTEELINEVYLTSIKKKEAELETLQAQINPHFLYNTLSSISRLSKLGEAEKLQSMVMDLAKFYRLTLNEGRTFIPVSKEIEQSQAYMNIQKIKYGDRMRVLYDIQSEIYHYDTIKLILQPLIENILEHAWFGDQINIRIVGYLEEDKIIFKIIDDGVGMHPHMISQILAPSPNPNVGYGIWNVNQRIKLHFGTKYGLSISSKLGMGTAVAIQIPTFHQEASSANK